MIKSTKTNKMNNNVKGLAKHNEFRNAVIDKLYEQTIIINHVTINVEATNVTGKYEFTSELATMTMNPVAKAFGLSNVVMPNTVIKHEDKYGNITKRIVNIDGTKYVYCDSILKVTCDDKTMIDRMCHTGLEFCGEQYIVACSSPSTEKHATKYFVKVTEEINNEVAVYNVIDKISGYVFSKGLFKGLVSGKKITKANTRWGNYVSGMISLAQIDLSKNYIAIVDDSIVGAYDFDEETRKQMLQESIDIDNHINDGAQYLNPAVVVEMANNVGVKMTERQAMREALQIRTTHVTGKCMAKCLEEQDMLRIAKFNKAKFYGNTNGKLMMLIDTDGAKAINYEDLNNKTAVLDLYVMAVANSSNPHTSSQHLIKHVSVNKEATVKTLKEMAKQQLDNHFYNKVTNGHATSVNDAILAVLGAEAMNTTIFAETAINDLTKFAASMIAKNKMEVLGNYSHMTFDLTYALTNGMINNILGVTKDGFIEAYSPDVNKLFHKEIVEIENNEELTEEQKEEQLFALMSGIVVKYPSAMPKEYEIIVYLTDKQIRERIEAKVAELDIDVMDKEDMMNMLVNYFMNTPWGTTVYAPINAMKNKLAGADCDFDATMCDMSELKWILINARLEEQKANPGFMGACTVISYKGHLYRKSLEEFLNTANEKELK